MKIPSLKEIYFKNPLGKWLWHISNARFRKFNPRKTAQGIIWFAKDKKDLIKNLHGADITNKKPIYLYKCSANVNNPAGWDEYDRYDADQLESLGYDSVDLDEDFIVLDANDIRIHKIIRLDNSDINEEYLGTKGGVQYFQMGGSLPKKLYNKKNNKGTKDVGVAGLKKGKSSSEELEKDLEKKKEKWYQKEETD